MKIIDYEDSWMAFSGNYVYAYGNNFGIDGVLMPVIVKGPEELEIVKNQIENAGMEVYINEDDFFQPLDWVYDYE